MEHTLKAFSALAMLAAISTPTFAQPVSIAPWMTGQRLVDLQRVQSGAINATQLTASQLADSMEADAYMDGVHDATEGKSWCYSDRYKPKPSTIKETLIWGLRNLPPAQLKRNAADLIVELLAAKYPCSANQQVQP